MPPASECLLWASWLNRDSRFHKVSRHWVWTPPHPALWASTTVNERATVRDTRAGFGVGGMVEVAGIEPAFTVRHFGFITVSDHCTPQPKCNAINVQASVMCFIVSTSNQVRCVYSCGWLCFVGQGYLQGQPI